MENQEKPSSNNETTQPDTAPTQMPNEPVLTIDSISTEEEDEEEEQKLDAIRKMRKRGIIGLILGSSAILGVLVFDVIVGAQLGSINFGSALIYTLIFVAYLSLTKFMTPIAIILLLISISEKKKYKLPFTKYFGMSIAGAIIALAPYIIAGVQLILSPAK